MRYFLYIVLAVVVYYLLYKHFKRQKYLSFFKDMGFGSVYLSKFSDSELYTAWDYIKNYSMKGIKLTPNIDPVLYAKAKAVDKKYKIFSNLD